MDNKKSVLNDTQVVTCECRLSYVNVFEAKKFKDDDKDAKYSCTALIPKNTPEGKATYERMKACIAKAAEKGAAKHFGGRVPTNVSNTLKDGDTEVDDMGELKSKKNPEIAGHWYIRLSSKFPPYVFSPDGQEMINPLDAYSGMYGKVSMTFVAYSGNGKRGVTALLNNVKKTKDGDPLVSRLTGDEFGE